MREEKDVKAVSAKLGVSKLADLRALPAEKLLDPFIPPQSRGFDFGPDVDGYFLPEPVPAIFAAGKQNDVPLLAGWNHDEGSFEIAYSPQKPSAESLKATAQKEFGAKAPEFLKLYPADSDQQALRSAQDFAGDSFIAFSTWQWLESQSKTGKHPVYRYRFDLGPPSDPKAPQLERITRRKSNTYSASSTPKPESTGDRRTANSAPRCKNTGPTSRAAATPTAPTCRNGRRIPPLTDGP